MVDLEAIEARANDATPGPWSCWGGFGHRDGRSYCSKLGLDGYNEADYPSGIFAIGHDLYGRDADFEFIAHAREDVPALIAEVKRLREEVATNLIQRFAVFIGEIEELKAELARFKPVAPHCIDYVRSTTERPVYHYISPTPLYHKEES